MEMATKLQILDVEDDLVWIDNNISLETKSNTDNSRTDLVNIAQCETKNISNSEQLQHMEFEEEKLKSLFERRLSIEDYYWEKSGNALCKSRIKPKLQTSNRMTIKEYKIISNSKMIRHPSFYKFDSRTTQILETLPIKTGLWGPISRRGNNSVTIHVECLFRNVVYYPYGLAVKVYKLGNNTKNNLVTLKHVQKEEEHLQRLSRHYSFSYPQFVYRSRNVMVTSFIGLDGETAPSIKNVSIKDWIPVYQTIVKQINEWYYKAGIVHGNLSIKNVLYFHGTPCYLGWSHSVPSQHPKALKKLLQDCHFVSNFFASRDVPVKSTEELFKEITGLGKISSKVMEGVYKKDLWKNLHQTNPNRVDVATSSQNRINRFKC